MKKIVCIILAIFVLVSISACGSKEPDESNNNKNGSYDDSVFDGIIESDASIFEYDDSFGKIVIKGFASEDYPEKVRIPSVIDGKNVTKIMAAAFKNCDKLKVIVFPEGITTLFGSTFMYCSELVAVKLPETIESLEAYEFSEASKLQSIYLPASLNYLHPASFYGSGISSLYVESGSFAEQWCNENNYQKEVKVVEH